MKKLLFATAFASTALASSMGCNTDSLTGLHFGLGVSVLFDKYEADVDVATISAEANQQLKLVTVPSDADVNKSQMASTGATDAANIVRVFGGTPASQSTAETIGDQDVFAVANTLYTSHQKLASINTAFVKKSTFKKRTTNCGGEVKLAYFHDFGNHLMVGVDLTGVIASKNKKTVKVEPSTIKNGTANVLSLVNKTTGVLIGNTTSDSAFTLNPDLPTTGNVIDSANVLEISNLPGLKAANPDFHTIMDATQLPEGYALKTTSGDNGAGELTFEKGVFNPRLAFIVGGTVYGWFAGLRMGMSYTTGKVYAKGLGQDKMSKTVSISSPLIGLHLMKQMKIAGNNDAHLYLTADWNIGDGRRTVDINGVKSFRQTSYNISAGLTWRFKLGN